MNIENNWKIFDLPQADIKFLDSFFNEEESNEFLSSLISGVPWGQDQITFYGKKINIPRLTQWYGESGLNYTWSGISMNPLPWNETVFKIKSRVQEAIGIEFNSVLLNRYRSGNDSVSWHADDEKELGQNPIIASVSLGMEREFQLKHDFRKDIDPIKIKLTNGSLLLMSGTTQEYWRHQIPKRKNINSERINLTFRQIK